MNRWSFARHATLFRKILGCLLLFLSCGLTACGANSSAGLPKIEIAGAVGALEIANWRWVIPEEGPESTGRILNVDPELARQRKLVADMVWKDRLIDQIEYRFYEGERELGRDTIPGNIFQKKGKLYTRYFPSGFANFSIQTATRLVVDVQIAEAGQRLTGRSDRIVRAAAACERGFFLECTELAEVFRMGASALGKTEPDKDLATYYSERMLSIGRAACEEGDMQACFFLGANLASGIGVEQDWERGRSLVEKACHADSILACSWLENYPTKEALTNPY